MSLNSPHGDPNRSLGPSLSYPYIILGAVLSPSPPLAAFSQTGSKAGIAAGSGDRAREQSFSILYPPSCDSMLSKPIYTLVPVFDILVPPKSNARHCRPGSSKVHFNFVDGRESDHDTYLYAILWVGMAPTWSRHAAYGSLTTLTSASEVPRFPGSHSTFMTKSRGLWTAKWTGQLDVAFNSVTEVSYGSSSN